MENISGIVNQTFFFAGGGGFVPQVLPNREKARLFSFQTQGFY